MPNDIVQANLAIAPSAPRQLFAAVATPKTVKLYRSDDAGENWTAGDDRRAPGRPDRRRRFAGHADRSAESEGGLFRERGLLEIDRRRQDLGRLARRARAATITKTSGSIRTTPKIVLLGSDQGAIITVNGGATWSSWYNQSTAQLYHVSADNAFPYRLYSGQQESGSVGIASRGPNGAITFRDWHPVAAEEYGYVTADPLDPDIVYGGKLTRYDRRTRPGAGAFCRSRFATDDFRMIRTQPILFSPLDPHLLFFATNTLWQTRDGGQNWKQISPDLTRKTFEIPASVGKFRDQPTAQPRQRGVIYTVAPSPLDKNRIWAGNR